MAEREFYRSVAGMSPHSPAAHGKDKDKDKDKDNEKVEKGKGKDEKGKGKDKEKGKEKDGESREAGEINAAAIHGEPGTGYESPEVDGVVTPFDCAHCHYLVGPVGAKGAKRGEKGCNQADMRANSDLPKFPDGRVQVEPKGCCEYIERIGSSSNVR